MQPDNRVPDHQLIGRLKHTPGSGILSLKCSSDGPTRVLTITDENKKVQYSISMNILIVGMCFSSILILVHGMTGLWWNTE